MRRETEGRRNVESPGSEGRGINVVDLVIGLALLLVVPAVCYVFAGMVWGKAEPMHDKVEVNPPPDGDEVDARWKEIQVLYSKNATCLAEVAQTVEDLNLKGQFRHWRDQCFQNVDKKLLDLEAFIKSYSPKHPDIEKTFYSHLGQIAELRRRVAAELAKAKDLDAKGDAGK